MLLSERLQQENQTLQQLTSDQSAHIQVKIHLFQVSKDQEARTCWNG